MVVVQPKKELLLKSFFSSSKLKQNGVLVVLIGPLFKKTKSLSWVGKSKILIFIG